MRVLLIISTIAGLAGIGAPTADAQDRILVNTDRRGLAIQGFDPVSYFTMPAPVRGEEGITASYQGATYRFATAANRNLFQAEPARYAPQFGGYCGYGASRDYLASVDPEAFTIMDGRLILQNSKRVLELWRKDPAGRVAAADKNWQGLVEREGKPAR